MRKLKSMFFIMFFCIVGINALAHDIALANKDGKTIYYVWRNNNTELYVFFRGTYYEQYSNEYTGNIVIPESVTYNGATYPVTGIFGSSFQDCSGLKSVTIPQSVKTIGSGAFWGCTGLTNITIPDGVSSIGDNTFYNCSNLSSITIPNSVSSIGSYVFYGTAWYNNQPNGLLYVGKVAYSYKGTMPANTSISLQEGTLGIAGGAFFGCSGLTNVIIPNSVTNIGDFAFQNCSKLTSVDIPNSVTSIGYAAFDYCSGLISVTIPNSVTIIREYLFRSCSSLKSVDIPNSVTSINYDAFEGCASLTNVTIPNSVTNIGSNSFAKLSNISDVYCFAENMPTTSSNAFNESSISNATLHVPAASLDIYSNTAPWSGFGNIVAIDPPEKCATPTMSFANGKLIFDCETEGVEFVPSVSLVDMQDKSQLELLSVYRFSVYAKKEGYVDSDVVAVNIDLNKLNGDINHDGQYTIADAVAIVNNILNDKTVIDPLPKFYYSVGTEAVTTENYTTVNNAHYKLSLSDIPETLDLSSISQQQVYILLPEGCMPIIRNAQGLVATNSVSLGNGYMVYTTTTAINGAECTCTVLK